MKRKLDMDRIAEGLGAERRGKVSATGGYFGAMQLLADVEAKFRVPAGGGRPTAPRGTALGSGGRRNRIGSAIPTPSCIQHSGCAAQPSTHGAARAKLLALSRTLGSTPSAFRRTLG